MFKSKRFIAFIISLVLFVLLVLITSYSPVEVAGALSIIAGIYIGADTFRPSTPFTSSTPTNSSDVG